MEKLEQLKIAEIDAFATGESKSTGEYFKCSFTSQVAIRCVDYATFLSKRGQLYHSEVKVESSERKRAKLVPPWEYYYIDAFSNPDTSSLESSRALARGMFVSHKSPSISLEIERLKSQVIAESRIQLTDRKNADDLARENDRLRKVNKILQRALSVQENADICLREIHTGTISEVLGDQVEVVYETPEGPLKQIYSRKQFMDGKFPKEGDKVEAHVFFATVDSEMDQTTESEFVSDLPSFRDKAKPGPIHL